MSSSSRANQLTQIRPGELAITPSQKALYRRKMELDPWYFSKYVCGHGERAVERIHRPLLYLYTRQAYLLAQCLDNERFSGYFCDYLKTELRRREIDWRTPKGLARLALLLRRVNVRLPRGSGKSVMADDANLWEGVMDPDSTIFIGSKADEYVRDRISAIGQVVLSPQFAFWFPDRVPLNPSKDVTRDSILLAGRRVMNRVEATIEGRGITSQTTGRHYMTLRNDDIVGTESGEASLDDALRHLAGISAIRDKIDWRGDAYIGTVTGENDDHSLLSADPGVLSVVMPVEVHEDGTTAENVYCDGEPVMPEWSGFSREGIDEVKNESRMNAKLGPISLLQNYYMVAHQAGVSLFTRSMLDRSLYRTLRDPGSNRRVILRPKRGREAECRKQWRHPFDKPVNLNLNDWFILDPSMLGGSAFGIAGDQSVTEDASGDEWALGAVCLDWEGVFYLLDVIKGRGYNSFIDAVPEFDRLHGARSRIGLDANATQGMTVEWMKRTPVFQTLARRVVPIRSGGEAKDVNIRNYIQSRMLAGTLFINPDLPDFHDELLRYRPRTLDGRKKRSVVDNQLDVAWMAMTLPVPTVSPDEEAQAETNALLRDTAPKTKSDRVMQENFFNLGLLDWSM